MYGSTLWKTSPGAIVPSGLRTTNVPVQASDVEGEITCVCSAASAVTGLKVEPAG